MRTSSCLLAVLVLFALLGTLAPAEAELDQETYERAAADALRNMKQPGLAKAKLADIATLQKDDQRRSVELLVRWAVQSGKLERRKLVPLLEEAQEDFDKLERILLKKYDSMPPNIKNDKDVWDEKKRDLDRATRHVDTENDVQYALGVAIAAVRNAGAIEWLLKSGLKQLRREDEAEEAAVGAVKALLEADPTVVADALLEEAESTKYPKARILALEWIGKRKNAAGYSIALDALNAKQDPVRRAALRSLVALDDPRCVEPLIKTMGTAWGTFRSELEDALHNFTGESFDESAEVWQRWWDEKGAAWLEGVTRTRWGPPQSRSGGGASFYGLQTKSNRIVFVLDRSGSMQTPASGEERAAEGDAEVTGDTKVEVAKNQLARSIKQLPQDVYFNVVFYSSDVQCWQEPTAMLPATEKNKRNATEWFMAQEAAGSTSTFDALLKAIEYADNLETKDPTKGGCDTIFLLSDGSPTGADGKVLEPAVIESEWARVKDANRIFHCVIHTVGIGRGHNSPLMRRIAKETGGTYKGVGN